MKFINKILGTRYWYNVRFIYRDKPGTRTFDFTVEIGLVKRSDILSYRNIKKCLPAFHKMKGINKTLLSNGVIGVEINAYLGWFKNSK